MALDKSQRGLRSVAKAMSRSRIPEWRRGMETTNNQFSENRKVGFRSIKQQQRSTTKEFRGRESLAKLRSLIDIDVVRLKFSYCQSLIWDRMQWRLECIRISMLSLRMLCMLVLSLSLFSHNFLPLANSFSSTEYGNNTSSRWCGIEWQWWNRGADSHQEKLESSNLVLAGLDAAYRSRRYTRRKYNCNRQPCDSASPSDGG